MTNDHANQLASTHQSTGGYLIAAMAAEDFSFPVETFPAATMDSPPLWRPSTESRRKETTTKEGETTERDVVLDQKSFSCTEIAGEQGRGGVRGEGMDLLWEDLNDEMPRSRSSRADSGDALSLGDRRTAAELGGVKLARARHDNKAAIGTVLKVLKKLFLIHSHSHHHHHHHHHRHRHPHHHQHHQNKVKTAHVW